MQNPNEDTEWNDVLRAKGILPPKPKEAEVTEDDLIAMVEQTIKQKSGSECFSDYLTEQGVILFCYRERS